MKKWSVVAKQLKIISTGLKHSWLLWVFCSGLVHAQESQELVVSTIAEVRANGDIYVADNGDVYITDFGNPSFANGSTVVKITAEGNASVFSSGLSAAPSGVTMDSNGNLYVATFSGGDVYRIAPNGNQTIINSGLSGPVGLTVDTSDNLYVVECSANRLSQLVNGSRQTIATLPGITCANGLIIGHDNAFYVLMWQNGQIFRVDNAGNSSLFADIPGAGSHLEYLDGFYYVSGRTTNKVYRIDVNGQIETYAGTGVDGNEDGPADVATISRPNGLGLDHNTGAVYATGSSDFNLNQIPIRKIALETSGNPNDFEINYGLAGSWFDPSQDGQGVVFDFAVGTDRFDAVMYWFTYNDEPADPETELTGFGSTQSRWFTAIGPVQGATVEMSVIRTASGVFNDPTAVSAAVVGTAEVEFFSCFEALLTFEFTEPEVQSGTIALQRITPDIWCEALLSE